MCSPIVSASSTRFVNGYALSRCLCRVNAMGLLSLCGVSLLLLLVDVVSIAGDLQSVYRSLGSLFTRTLDLYIVGIM